MIRSFFSLLKYYFIPSSGSWLRMYFISSVRHLVGDGHSDRLCRSLSLHKHCETQPCAGRIEGHFRTVGLSLKFHPLLLLCTARGGKTNRSTCIKRSSQDWEAGDFPSIVSKRFGNFGIEDSRPLWTLPQKGIFLFLFFSCVCRATEFKGRMMQLSAHRFLAVYLTLFGYLGDVYAGTVLMNSNAIKNLPGASGGKGTNTVSPSPRTSPSGSLGQKLPADTLQVIHFPVRKSQICAARTQGCVKLTFMGNISTFQWHAAFVLITL